MVGFTRTEYNPQELLRLFCICWDLGRPSPGSCTYSAWITVVGQGMSEDPDPVHVLATEPLS